MLLVLSVFIHSCEQIDIDNTSDDSQSAIPSDTLSQDSLPELYPSGTLPVINITTENHAPIVDKINPINAVCNIDVPDGSDYPALSDATITIRGRGNSTWRWPKKPYKIKFETKAEPLGLKKNKHFALIAHNVGFGDWFGCMAGYQIAKTIEMGWTPEVVPVELMLNGSYEGIYFLTETVRVDKNRLDITPQPDSSYDASILPYGWLIEIDNYVSDNQFTIEEAPGKYMKMTCHTPKSLSDIQMSWIKNEMEVVNRSVWHPSHPDEWAEQIDPIQFAKYFIVREILHDGDAYSGSFYFYRDNDPDGKWMAGPMWDCTVFTKDDWIVNSHPEYAATRWVPQIMKSPLFWESVKIVWGEYRDKILSDVSSYLDYWGPMLDKALEYNAMRWPEISKTGATGQARYIKGQITNAVYWIDQNIDTYDKVESKKIEPRE